MGETTIRQALEEFKTEYMPARNYAPRTRTEYINDLEDLADFLEAAGYIRIGEIGLSQLERYQTELDNRGLAGSTRKRKTITIRSFFDFLHRRGYVTYDVARHLIPPYSENYLPRVLTSTEYQRLLSICSENIRDTAIVELLLQTGIRLTELVRLHTYDIDLSEDGSRGLVRIVNGGGRRGREIPLNSKACQALKIYLQNHIFTSTQAMFINRFGKPLGPRGVQKMLYKYFTQIGIHGASVRSFRHTFGTQHMAKGTKQKNIQEVMGHKDIRSLEVYAILANQLKEKELEEHSL